MSCSFNGSEPPNNPVGESAEVGSTRFKEAMQHSSQYIRRVFNDAAGEQTQ